MGSETERLRKQMEEQMVRLVAQLGECAELEAEEPEEAAELRAETEAQLAELSASLDRLAAGSLSLTDDLAAMKLAIRAAVTSAFRTPEIIRLFAQRQPAQLRLKLSELERDVKAGRVQAALAEERRTELLGALQKLGDELSEEEAAFLQEHQNPALADFAQAADGAVQEATVRTLIASSKSP